VRISHDGPGPAFAAPKPVVLAPGAKAGFVITSADNMGPKFACRTAAELKVTLPRVGGTTTVLTANGPSDYLLCAVPPAIALVNVSSLVTGHEADLYAPASTVRSAPPGSGPAATATEVARFVARAASGFDGPVQLSYAARTSVGSVPTTLDAAIASATSWAYEASPSIFSVRSSGASAAVFMNPTNEPPGLYSCVRSASRSAWTCRSDASVAMGGRAELLGPSPQVALLDGLRNAVKVYANPVALGGHVAAEAPHLLDQGTGADAQFCLLYGLVGSPVAFVCLGTGGVIARYNIPQAVTSSSYVTAVLTSEARSLLSSALTVPAPLPGVASRPIVAAPATPAQVAAFMATAEKVDAKTFSATYEVGVPDGRGRASRSVVQLAQHTSAVYMYRETPPFGMVLGPGHGAIISYEVWDVAGAQRNVAHFTNVVPGYYSCTLAVNAPHWACQGPYGGIGMGTTFELTGPYPPNELLLGLSNAVATYSGHKPAYLFGRRWENSQLRCLGFGQRAHLVGQACLGPGDLIAYYNLPTAVSYQSYSVATLTAYSAEVPDRRLDLPSKPAVPQL
jgi:hypothetical protein